MPRAIAPEVTIDDVDAGAVQRRDLVADAIEHAGAQVAGRFGDHGGSELDDGGGHGPPQVRPLSAAGALAASAASPSCHSEKLISPHSCREWSSRRATCSSIRRVTAAGSK